MCSNEINGSSEVKGREWTRRGDLTQSHGVVVLGQCSPHRVRLRNLFWFSKRKYEILTYVVNNVHTSQYVYIRSCKK